MYIHTKIFPFQKYTNVSNNSFKFTEKPTLKVAELGQAAAQNILLASFGFGDHDH
eukprot:m.29185 g.29185  ORF g.29185 m.29185 type:complete len:55 (-) comp16053_c0_seq1:155-319(-)